MITPDEDTDTPGEIVPEIRGTSSITITLRDNDTGVEVCTSVTLMTGNQPETRRLLGKSFVDTLDRLWPIDVITSSEGGP